MLNFSLVRIIYSIGIASATILLITPMGKAAQLFEDARPLTSGEFFADNNLLKLNTEQGTNGWFSESQGVDFKNLPTFRRTVVVKERKRLFSDEVRVTRDIDGGATGQLGDTLYSLNLRGAYADLGTVSGADPELWGEDGAKTSGDLQQDSNKTNDKSRIIPSDWRTKLGFRSPTGSSVSFKRIYSLDKQRFEVGEFGCPTLVPNSEKATAYCEFSDAWFAANLDIGLQIELKGDISDEDRALASTVAERVKVFADGDRTIQFFVNDNLLTTVEIDTDPAILELELREKKETTTEANFQVETTIEPKEDGKTGFDVVTKSEFETKVSTTIEKSDEEAQFILRYFDGVTSNSFFSVGKTSQYEIELLDLFSLFVGINGTAFTRADVLSSIEASNPQLAVKVVGKAIPVTEPQAIIPILAIGTIGIISVTKKKVKILK